MKKYRYYYQYINRQGDRIADVVYVDNFDEFLKHIWFHKSDIDLELQNEIEIKSVKEITGYGRG